MQGKKCQSKRLEFFGEGIVVAPDRDLRFNNIDMKGTCEVSAVQRIRLEVRRYARLG